MFSKAPPKKKMRFSIANLLELSGDDEDEGEDLNQIGSGDDSDYLKKYVRMIQQGEDEEYNDEFKFQKWRSTFSIEDLPADPEELLRRLFTKCIDEAIEGAKRNGLNPDHVGLTISSRLLDPDIWIKVRPLTANTVDAALNRFKLVAQSKSKEGNLYGEPFSVTVTTVDKLQLERMIQNPQPNNGGPLIGSGRAANLSPIQHRIVRKCLIPVKNSQDSYCLFHALFLTYIRKMKTMSTRMFYNIVHRDHDRRAREVANLMGKAEIPTGQPEYDARLYAPFVVNYWNEIGRDRDLRYKVFIFESTGHYKPAYMHGADNFNMPIVLYYDSKHFWGVRSVASLFEQNNYCLTCLCPYWDAARHRKDCKQLCLYCGRMGFGCSFAICTLDYERFCEGCSKKFINRECYEKHKENKFCDRSKKCQKCGVIWDVEDNTRNGRTGHKCMERYCKQCDCFHSKERGCFIQPRKPHKQLPVYRCIAFDFETVQDRTIDHISRKKIHEVNFAGAVVFCTRCIEQNFWKKSLKEIPPCQICGPHRTVTFSHRPFRGTEVDKQIVTLNPLKDFVHWVLRELPLNYPTLAFAHYGGRFDITMVFGEVFKMNEDSSLIKRGNKLYQLRVNPSLGQNPLILFRDSYNLFPIALGKLIGAFGLAGLKDKPFFPYIANCKNFYDRTLPQLPAKDLYLYKGFMPEKKREFENWYTENGHREFNLNNELASYCVNDCWILAAALVAFRKEFLEISQGEKDQNGTPNHLGIDPLRDGITISSNCLLNFRLNHLKSDQHLGVVPENGYETCDSQSTLALKFFKWFSQKFNVQLQTAHNGGEKKMGKYFLDAYYETKKGEKCEKIGIEFHGCVYHAHECRFPDDDELVKPVGKTAGWVRKRDAVREQYLRKHLTHLHIIYECKLNEMLKRDNEMRKVFNDYMDEGPIRIREQGFYGGRTGPFKLYHEIKQEGEAIGYLDFRSLYPSTNFNTSYPIKHPKVLKFTSKEQQNIEWTRPEDCPYNGFVKVLVVPPARCSVPPLPVKFDERLLFPLCRACCLQYPEGGWNPHYHCTHGDKKRAWVATASTLELKEALRDGYRVIRLFRALHYPPDQWDAGLFKKYVADFMTIKTHSSGFPEDVDTPEKEEQFISECRERFGMNIEREKMVKNDARRTLSKLCLNSLWGRFSLRNDLSRSVITREPEEFCKLLANRSIEISSITTLAPKTIFITYDTQKEYIVENEGSNVIISAWTTSAARIKLLEAMRKIAECPGAELLYTDTDSCIYSYKIGQNPLEVGNHLGDLASEVPAGFEIIEFVCAGAKQYGMKLRRVGTTTIDDFKYVLKIRGFSLNHTAAQRLNYETFKEQVLSFARGTRKDPIGVTYSHFIRPDIRTGTVTSSPLTKFYKPVLTKGILGPDFCVRTFGEKKC